MAAPVIKIRNETNTGWYEFGHQGPQGYRGYQGFQGSQGEPGRQGDQGLTGNQGAMGDPGPQGVAGPQGEEGRQGDQGAIGNQGAMGQPGPQGIAGQQGVQGHQGDQGVVGNQGVQGAIGSTGVTGAQGAQGSQGHQGFQGITGNQGVPGNIGPQGLQGPQGSTGSNGIDGATGAQGVQGSTGPTGPQGTQGPQGSQGHQGFQGVIGLQGSQGSIGIAGLVWKGDWVSGTYESGDVVYYDGSSYVRETTGSSTLIPPSDLTNWDLLSSVGSIGPQGQQGTTGAQGPTGPQGDQGLTGTTGAQGATGPQGSQGVIGNTGPTGPQGDQGVIGNTGPTGPQGNQGTTGVQGATGLQGTQGLQGSTGSQGATGAQGSQGDIGVQGPDGPQGDQGLRGFQGSTGAQGSQGDIGVQGPDGPQGDQGLRGYQGLTGATGSQGNVGAQGPNGPQGTQGKQGSQGNQGAQGAQGTQGAQGLLGDVLAHVVGVQTTGRIYQGTGTWNINETGTFTGSALWSEGSPATMFIGGWNAGKKQWWGGSDGLFHANDGDMILGNSGLFIKTALSYDQTAGRIRFGPSYLDPVEAYSDGVEMTAVHNSYYRGTYLYLSAYTRDAYPTLGTTSIQINAGAGPIDGMSTDAAIIQMDVTRNQTVKSKITMDAQQIVLRANYPSRDWISLSGKLAAYEANIYSLHVTSNPYDTTVVGASNAKIDGNLTVGADLYMSSASGIVYPGNGVADYKYVHNGSTVGATWIRIARVTIASGTYAGANFDIEYVYGAGNWGQALPITYNFKVRITRSGSTQDDTVNCYVSGTHTDFIRAVKVSNSVYEIQTRTLNNYTINTIHIKPIVASSSRISVEYGTATAGTGTVYSSVVEGAWSSWTPTITYYTTPYPTSVTVTYADYKLTGKSFVFNLHLAVTRGTGQPQVIYLSLPVTVSKTYQSCSAETDLIDGSHDTIAAFTEVNRISIISGGWTRESGYLIVGGTIEIN